MAFSGTSLTFQPSDIRRLTPGDIFLTPPRAPNAAPEMHMLLDPSPSKMPEYMRLSDFRVFRFTGTQWTVQNLTSRCRMRLVGQPMAIDYNSGLRGRIILTDSGMGITAVRDDNNDNVWVDLSRYQVELFRPVLHLGFEGVLEFQDEQSCEWRELP